MPLQCSVMPNSYLSKSVSSKNELRNNEDKTKKKNEFSTDVRLLSIPQLLELLERQNKLIASKALLKLPDKGEKVKKLKDDIENEIAKRKKEEDNILDGLTKLSITEKKIELLEWGEKSVLPSSEATIEDEQNPLAILATHSGTNFHQKKIVVEKEEPLISLADIEEAYALNLCNKIDKAEQKQRFLPHKTLKSSSKSTFKTRDLSAATPPAPVFGDVKMISLEQSLKLQYEYTQHLKEVQLKHATERLKGNKFKMGDALPEGESTKTYREHNSLQYSEEEEDGSENEE